MSLTKNLIQAVSPGSLLLAVVGYRGGSVTGITQTGATWTLLASSTSAFENVDVWASSDAFGASSQIDITTASTIGEEAIILEYGGLYAPAGSYLDQFATNTGSSSTASTGTTPTTTDAVELWLGVFCSRANNPVSSPGNGFTIIDQVSSGPGAGDVNVAVTARVVSTTGPASTTVNVTSVFWAAAIVTLFGTPPPSVLSLSTVDPQDVSEEGGQLIKVLGDYSGELGNAFRVHVGPNADATDPECLSGKPGDPTDVFPLSATELRCYTPNLDQGLQQVYVRRADDSRSGVLGNALTVHPRSFETSVFDLRRVLPPRWVKGPVIIEEES